MILWFLMSGTAIVGGCETVGRQRPIPSTTVISVAPSYTEIAPSPPQPTVAEEIAASLPTPVVEIEMTFVGDVIFGRYRETGFDPIVKEDFDVFEPMKSLLSADLVVGNLETPLTRELPKKSPIRSRFAFGACMTMATLLQRAGFTAMSIANNHWFDLHLSGVEETPILLNALGIVPLGLPTESIRVTTIEHNDFRVGFIAVTTLSNVAFRPSWPEPAFVPLRDLARTLGPLLEAERPRHDILVVSVHWGTEYADQPSGVQVRMARRMVDAGADLIIGHHPHVLQAIERYQTGIIAYSMGNFLFENTNDIPRQTGVLRTTFQQGQRCPARVTFHPAYIRRRPVPHPVPAKGHMGRIVRNRVTSLSAPFQTRWHPEGEDLVLDLSDCAAESTAPNGQRIPPRGNPETDP